MYQNSWTPTILNSVFILWTFRLTLQNLQKLLIFPMSLLSIMNSPMFLAKLKLKFLLLIILMTSKSIWKKVLNLQFVKFENGRLGFSLVSFSFLFSFWFIFHFSIFRNLGLVLVIISLGHTAVTSDDLVTVTVTSHIMQGRIQKVLER